ncbi:FERM, RhoGEF and pleckstrin domain protein 2 [Mytilus galloprovincialis]|uniref:FERM, RhoGEF and pleckstrin domain protein 2 n=2 Tax=Mytilus galloprovincialis TaxID=29158 RepID=A0A8B6DLZ2_MYTGA|nr:FERM, RhoGEF and pleckstrin domain protein 2 [Mytilus galloprovincialis]
MKGLPNREFSDYSRIMTPFIISYTVCYGIANSYTVCYGIANSYTVCYGIANSYTVCYGIANSYTVCYGIANSYTVCYGIDNSYTVCYGIVCDGIANSYAVCYGIDNSYTVCYGIYNSYTVCYGIDNNYTACYGIANSYTVCYDIDNSYTVCYGIDNSYTVCYGIVCDGIANSYTVCYGIAYSYIVCYGIDNNYTVCYGIDNNYTVCYDLPPPYPSVVSKPPHGLRQEDRKMSAPVFGTKDYQNARDRQNENRLSRCDEVENIPTVVQEEPEMDEDFHCHVNRTVSENDNSMMERDESPPPPPPPPLDDDIPFTPPCYRSTPQRDIDHGTSILSEHEGPRSNVSVLSSSRTEDSEDDHRKKAKRHLVDRAYYIAKELLMTERTYKKDLEVITVWFRNAVSNEETIPDCLITLFSSLVPIYEFHCDFLKELDQRLSMWEGKTNAHMNGDYQRIGDIMSDSFNTNVLNMYKHYIDHVEDLLTQVQENMKRNKKFDQMYKEFESQKVCYLPLNTFFLKPGQRLLHYRLILERITKHYSMDHQDYADCDACLKNFTDAVSECKDRMKLEENLQKLIELQRDMIGIDTLVDPDRNFIREGCLQKFSRKGYQQRMFFLFSDILLYSSRTASSLLQFKVHGQLPLRGMIVEESDHAKMAVANSFAIYGGNKCILVAASSQEEKDKWIEDLNEAIISSGNRNDSKLKYASLKSSTSSSENVDGETPEINGHVPEKQIHHRSNTTMHVCWHRNTSVSLRDHEKSVRNQMSGYLLRKFKNSNGWQKLWVVFTNFCLFFYKTYQDDFPLASLPLLGYAVNTPDDEDGIHKDHVFKLQFKNHVYFFRAESEYTFERWMEVINSATNSARRIRLFSRLDSQHAS